MINPEEENERPVPQFPTDRIELTIVEIPQFPADRIEKGQSSEELDSEG